MSDEEQSIIELLGQRHKDDVFVPECKDGPSWFGNHYRLDAWAMSKSWANPLMTGYEIKHSRSDFLNDNKWMNYLPLCNQLYFVCPMNLIDIAEIPAEAGLMYRSATGTRLFTKKKAPYRKIEEPVDLLKYVLMCRAYIKHRWYDADKDQRNANIEKWSDWLRTKDESKDLGKACSSKIAKLIQTRIRVAEIDAREAKHLAQQAEELKAALHALGFPWPGSWQIDSTAARMVEARSWLTPGRIRALERARDELQAILDSATIRRVRLAQD